MKCKYKLCTQRVKGDEYCCVKCNYFADMNQLMMGYLSRVTRIHAISDPLNSKLKNDVMEAMCQRTMQYIDEKSQENTAFDKGVYK
ncbi:MAG: hypothetical protein OXC46_03390 [Thaumarchaeota archaeon]|nr:hypothetical protein [Nitrososphaerota archaeon]